MRTTLTLLQPGDTTRVDGDNATSVIVWILIIIGVTVVGYLIYKYMTTKKDDEVPPIEPKFKPKDPTPKL